MRLNRDPERCRQHYHDTMHLRLLGRGKAKPERVRCLGPLTPIHWFISEDKKKFRVCPACKLWNAGQPDSLIDMTDDVTEADLADPTLQEDDTQIIEEQFSDMPNTAKKRRKRTR